VAVTIEGFERPLLVTLFMTKDGYAHMLEATTAGDSTVGIDLSAFRFEIVHDGPGAVSIANDSATIVDEFNLAAARHVL
jgi:hypothetical protein